MPRTAGSTTRCAPRLWKEACVTALRRLSLPLLLGSEPMGYRPLRYAIADYLTVSRAVKCDPEQIAIVSGVLEALDLVARVMLDRGDRVCVEDPGYQGAVSVFETIGAKVAGVPLDEQGMKVPRVRGARLAYITPAHQFPVGTTMTLARRLKLLEWARSSGALIFEDDYDSEYRYSGRPVPSLQGLDASGQVLFCGTFNKVLFPSLRIASLVIPDDLVPHFSAAIAFTRRHAPLLDQAVLCDFITEGHFGRHLRRAAGLRGAAVGADGRCHPEPRRRSKDPPIALQGGDPSAVCAAQDDSAMALT